MDHNALTAASWVPVAIWYPKGEQIVIDETLSKVIHLLRFPTILRKSTTVLWEAILDKFSACFNFVRIWWGEWWLVFWESHIHYDASENITLYYDGIPCAYISFSANSQYTIIQTVQWVWTNPQKLSEFDWESSLIDTVEQIARIYFPNTKVGIIDDISHPFFEKMPKGKYDQLADRLGYMQKNKIKRPPWLLFYEWEEINVWLKNTDS